MAKKIMTLIVAHRDNQILLGMKKRGFGQGRWNGFGGKLNEGEGVEEAARRELKEEAGLAAKNLDLCGIMTFTFPSGEVLEVHLFKMLEFEGEPQETEEMRPQWFDIDKIPFDDMWPDDPYWMPLFLQDKKFRGDFIFADDGKTVADYNLKEVEEI